MHQNGSEDHHNLSITFSALTHQFGPKILHRRNITEAPNSTSTECAVRARVSHSCDVLTLRDLTNAAVADGPPISLVHRPRRQLSRPSQDHRRRGARGDRCTTTVEFTQSPYLHRVLPRPSPSSSAPDRRGEFTVSFSSSHPSCPSQSPITS